MARKLIYLCKPTKRASDSFLLVPSLLFFCSMVLAILLFCTFFKYPQKIPGVGILLLKGELKTITSPVTGIIESWLLEEGESVSNGQEIAIIRDHENPEIKKTITAAVDGVLAEIIAYPNTQALVGQTIALVTNHGDPRTDLEFLGFVSSLEGKKIRPGMKALVDPSVADSYLHGHLEATVSRVGKLPMTKEAIQSVIKIPEIAKYVRKQIAAEPFFVVLSLVQNSKSITGYHWTGPGPSFELDTGIIGNIAIIYDEKSLMRLLWPAIFQPKSRVL